MEKRGPGQQTKYKPEYCEEIVKWFSSHPKFPSIEGYATHLNVCVDSIYEWANVHPSFSEAKRKALAIQKNKLMNQALDGSYKETASIFLLKRLHGMEDPPQDHNLKLSADADFLSFINTLKKPTEP